MPIIFSTKQLPDLEPGEAAIIFSSGTFTLYTANDETILIQNSPNTFAAALAVQALCTPELAQSAKTQLLATLERISHVPPI